MGLLACTKKWVEHGNLFHMNAKHTNNHLTSRVTKISQSLIQMETKYILFFGIPLLSLESGGPLIIIDTVVTDGKEYTR